MIKFHIYLILIFGLNITSSFALPRFAVANGASCIACHVNPTGSGLRNSHGNEIVALEELPMKRWMDKGDEDWDGFITEHLQIGGDLRLQGIQYNDSDSTRKSSFFPMQADIYTHLKLNKNAGIFSKVGFKGSGPPNIEYWILISDLPQKAWLKVGRTLPNYGLRVDDHTSFIRGGNLGKTSVGLDKEGLLFTPFLSLPAILELGVPISARLEWTASLGTSLLNSNQEMNNISTKLTHRGSLGDNIEYRSGFSYMQEDEFNMAGVSGGISYCNFTWTMEVDQAKNWINGNTSMALYDELAWEVIQGIQLIGKYDFFDPKIDWTDGSVSRYTLGVEIYPLNIMEIKLQVRINEVEIENALQKDLEYLIQTHLYF